jgi:hypothetical protein
MAKNLNKDRVLFIEKKLTNSLELFLPERWTRDGLYQVQVKCATHYAPQDHN